VNLAGLLGQDRAVRVLKRLLAKGTPPPALLFHGPSGVGKAAAAYAFAKALNCGRRGQDACPEAEACPSCSAADRGLDPDLQRVDAAYQAAVIDGEAGKQHSIRVATVRHLLRRLEMRSLEGRWKAAILVDAHTLETEAANAILKTLEEPPPRTVWVLVTHRPAELLPTVRSRCQAVPFAALAAGAVERVLLGRGVIPAEAARAAALSQGSVDRALEALDSALADPAEWVRDPLAPFQLADSLPRELHLARPRAEAHLDRVTAHLRARGAAAYASGSVRFVLRDLEALRRALRRFADPRLVTQLAALRLQELDAVERPR
jgi:DNA polymerase-3 subunit delta'